MKLQVSIKDIHGGSVDSHIASFTGGGSNLLLGVRTKLVGYTHPVFFVQQRKGNKTTETTFERIEEAVDAYNRIAEPQESPRDKPMRFKVGDQVAFVNRAQDGYGQRIEAVDPVHRLVRTGNYKWWTETCFMPWAEWEAKYGKR